LRNKGRNTDYSRLKRRLYWYILVVVMAAILLVLFLNWGVNGRLGERIVIFLQGSFDLSRDDAMKIYQYVVRNNMGIILAVAIAICFLILCRVLLTRFTSYFDEVSTGLDALVSDGDAQIELSEEMDFMEKKLNTLKSTLEKRQQDARLAEQRKNDLVMYLAHDIKTPLTSVIGYLDLLDEAPDMPMEQRAKYVSITLEKACRLEQLIDEFFEITRYNLQTLTLSKQRIDLQYMLVQMTDEFYPLLAAKGQHAHVRLPEGLTITGDADKLARVFNNILKNAIAYGEEGSDVDITAEPSDDVVSIVFSNAGSIAEDKLAVIFEKFYRLDDARPSSTGGAGLGLAIAREIVVQHGGRIHARSEGGRTSFIVELPALPDPGEDASTIS
jgi:two-component system sensor histidine kinase VanS